MPLKEAVLWLAQWNNLLVMMPQQSQANSEECGRAARNDAPFQELNDAIKASKR
jgi:hypothetical protein